MRNRPLSLLRALGSARLPVVCPSPESRGMARRDGAPVNPGCPVGSGLIETHRSLDAPRASRRAIRGILGNWPTTSLGPGASSFSAPTRLVVPRNAPGRDCESRPEVPHPAPSLRARADAPRWTGRWEYKWTVGPCQELISLLEISF